jgi:hypothetical protein
LAAVRLDGKWGYIDKAGEIVIQARFRGVGYFSEGLAPVLPGYSPWGSLWGYIDKAGKFVIEPQFSDAESFSEGLAAVALNAADKRDRKFGYIGR